MTNTITLRVAGPYTVTSNGLAIMVNGRAGRVDTLKGDREYTHVVDTGCKGANGRPDAVRLTAAQIAQHTALRDSLPTVRRERLSVALNLLLAQQADAQDAAVNNTLRTGRAVLAQDLTAQIEAARAALVEFDAAHPEVLAEIQAKAAARKAELMADAFNI